jgi:hypothetical protein
VQSSKIFAFGGEAIRTRARNDAIDSERHFAIANCRTAKGLLDHLIGEQLYRIGHDWTEGLCRLQIDDKFERVRFLDRDIGRLAGPTLKYLLPISCVCPNRWEYFALGVFRFWPVLEIATPYSITLLQLFKQLLFGDPD